MMADSRKGFTLGKLCSIKREDRTPREKKTEKETGGRGTVRWGKPADSSVMTTKREGS